MQRLGHRSAVISSRELVYGWTLERQLERNPAARRAFPDHRRRLAALRYRHRAQVWARRAVTNGNPSAYRCAAYALEQALRLERTP